MPTDGMTESASTVPPTRAITAASSIASKSSNTRCCGADSVAMHLSAALASGATRSR